MGKVESPSTANQGSQTSVTINPKLQDVLDRATNTTMNTFDVLSETSKAFSPIKSLLNISAQSLSLYKDLDWTNLPKNILNFSAYSEPMQSLTELQQATVRKLSEEQQKVVNDQMAMIGSQDDSQAPQNFIACILDRSLDAYDHLTRQQIKQAQLLDEIQSTYLTWYQQALTSFSKSMSAH